jgi:hypothetical protein
VAIENQVAIGEDLEEKTAIYYFQKIGQCADLSQAGIIFTEA